VNLGVTAQYALAHRCNDRVRFALSRRGDQHIEQKRPEYTAKRDDCRQ